MIYLSAVGTWLGENWAQILFSAVTVAVLGVYYYLVRRERSAYLQKTGVTSRGVDGAAAYGNTVFMAASQDEPAQAIVRHVVSFLAGLLVLLGVFTETLSVEVTGGVLGIAAIFFSWNSLDKEQFQEQLTGVLRHVVTFAGGMGWIAGDLQQNQWYTYGGLAITLLGVLWSLKIKKDKLKTE